MSYGLVRQIGPWRSTARDRSSTQSFVPYDRKQFIKPGTVRAPGLPGTYDPFKGWHVVSKKAYAPSRAKKIAYGRGDNPVSRMDPYVDMNDYSPQDFQNGPEESLHRLDHKAVEDPKYSQSESSYYPPSTSDESDFKPFQDRTPAHDFGSSDDDYAQNMGVVKGVVDDHQDEIDEELARIKKEDEERLRWNLERNHDNHDYGESFHGYEMFPTRNGRNPPPEDYFNVPYVRPDRGVYPPIEPERPRVFEQVPVSYPTLDDLPPTNSLWDEGASIRQRAREIRERSVVTNAAPPVPETAVASTSGYTLPHIPRPHIPAFSDMFNQGSRLFEHYRDLTEHGRRRFNTILDNLLAYRNSILRSAPTSTTLRQIGMERRANDALNAELAHEEAPVRLLIEDVRRELEVRQPLRRSGRRRANPNYVDDGSDGSQKDNDRSGSYGR